MNLFTVSTTAACYVAMVVFLLTQPASVEAKNIRLRMHFENDVKIFSHDPLKNGVVDLTDLPFMAQSFCESTGGDMTTCPTIITDSFTQIVNTRLPMFLDDDIVVSQFSEDLLRQACGNRDQPAGVALLDSGGSNSYDPEEAYDRCVLDAAHAIRSVKVMRTNSLAPQLYNEVAAQTLVPLEQNWDYGVEGNTMSFIGKLITNQNLVDDPRVESVTEIGFNMGHSCMNWLIGNPKVSYLGFDISRHKYTAAGINAIHKLFPGRTVNLIEGDSSISIPSFTRLLRQQTKSDDVGLKFNLLFIDGDHSYEGALADIINYAPYANTTYHRVIIDDCSLQVVKDAITTTEERGILRLIEEIVTPQTLCFIAHEVQQGPFGGSYQFRNKTLVGDSSDEQCVFVEVPGAPFYIDSLCIAEYIM